jgi:hypothetical protein
MSDFRETMAEPRIAATIDEIRAAVLERYPGTTFRFTAGEGPDTVWMWATVDIDDPDEVGDLVAEKVINLVIDDRNPLLFIPVWPRERNEAYLRERAASDRPLAPTGTAP